MNKDYYKPYEGRDIKILDQHAANTIAEDHLTFPYQLLDHLAHVLMLKEQGIISQEDAAQILGAVLKLRREGPDIVPHKPGLTDLYSNVEEWVIAQVGIQVGGKMHTGRSRNDMNPAIERMYIRRKLLEQMEAITFLMETLLVQAEVHKNTIIPAYTHHSQQAQPITLGHFYMSAFENFGRDMERLMRAYEHVDLSPMGAAAVATTGFPISRERVAELLGFHGMLVNSMDATSTLDYAYEPACAMAIFINNVGRVQHHEGLPPRKRSGARPGGGAVLRDHAAYHRQRVPAGGHHPQSGGRRAPRTGGRPQRIQHRHRSG